MSLEKAINKLHTSEHALKLAEGMQGIEYAQIIRTQTAGLVNVLMQYHAENPNISQRTFEVLMAYMFRAAEMNKGEVAEIIGVTEKTMNNHLHSDKFKYPSANPIDSILSKYVPCTIKYPELDLFDGTQKDDEHEYQKSLFNHVGSLSLSMTDVCSADPSLKKKIEYSQIAHFKHSKKRPVLEIARLLGCTPETVHKKVKKDAYLVMEKCFTQ